MSKVHSIISTPLKYLWKSATPFFRPLPNTFIVGAQKAGTSSLHSYLCQHPKVIGATKKELHYFSGGLRPEVDNFSKSTNWYRSHFPICPLRSSDLICLDSTPMYLFHPLVPQRISAFNPASKIIILLRNPVERAISHYFHTKKHGFETLKIEDAIKGERDRLSSILDKKHFSHPDFRTKSYCMRGLYLDQITRYMNHFPNEQIKIICSEELFSFPEKVVKETIAFLDIEQSQKKTDYKPVNVAQSRPKAPLELIKWLEQYYEPHNEKLFKLLGRSFDW
ncbi:sulfotransferase family protein [Thalassotalea euphylliae]|uniref:sulfotransferase family protein n=1 Tax=Thalassotalea euphylliae TaxID=1655234 RepID=UPI0036285F88